MIKRTCKQCGKEFILSDSEIRFFKSKNLNLPKRCKECRSANKQSNQSPSAPVQVTASKPAPKLDKKKLIIAIAIILVLVIGSFFGIEWDKFFSPESNPLDSTVSDLPTEQLPNDESEVIVYYFADDSKWISHFEKHGKDVGAKTKEEYLAMANALILNPNALSKKETDDGDNDTVYFLEATGEFAVLSDKGVIRTYYNNVDLDYFNRQ